MPAPKVDLTKFLADPEHQGDRDLFFGVIDARLKFHAEEAEKRRAAGQEGKTLLQRIFDGE